MLVFLLFLSFPTVFYVFHSIFCTWLTFCHVQPSCVIHMQWIPNYNSRMNKYQKNRRFQAVSVSYGKAIPFPDARHRLILLRYLTHIILSRPRWKIPSSGATHFGYKNTTPLRPGNPAAHPTCRLMLLPSGPDMIHRGESHETRTSSRNGRD